MVLLTHYFQHYVDRDSITCLTVIIYLPGMVSIPVSVYQTVVTSMAQLNDGHPSNVQIALAPLSNDDTGLGHVTIKEMDSESDSEQMVVASPVYTIKQRNSGNVPDATQAVEVMTVEPELKVQL